MALYDTPAKILSAGFITLGRPEPELLGVAEFTNIVFRKLAYYYEGCRASDQNIASKKTVEFTLTGSENSIDLTAFTGGDIITPLWCEVKAYDSIGTNPVWAFVPTVNMDTLPERRAETILAVGYYGDNPTQLTAEFSFYGDEAILPNNTFRIWYTPQNVFSPDINASVNIPDNLLALIMVDTCIVAIGQIEVNAGKYLEKRPSLKDRIVLWDKLEARLKEEKAEWMEWYTAFRTQSRSYHRAVNHNDVLTEALAYRRWGRTGGYGGM